MAVNDRLVESLAQSAPLLTETAGLLGLTANLSRSSNLTDQISAHAAAASLAAPDLALTAPDHVVAG